MFLWLSLALALTPAGTEIRNQASATYVDSAGQPRTTTSNLVVTVVQQVYSFTITPDGTESSPGQTRQGLPGAQVLFNYQVKNTGNGTDTINLSTFQGTADDFDLTNVEIFLDTNCNGNLDAGETTPITSVTLAMDESACVIVQATIPANATSGQYGNLNLTGTSAGNPNVTDTDNWARANVTEEAVLTAFKSASPSGSVAPGGTITYTISGSNTGGGKAAGVSVNVDGSQRTGILIADTIPTGLTVSTMPTGSAGAGTVRFVYTTDGMNWSTLSASNLPLTGDGTIAIGMLIEGSGDFFPQGAGYTFNFEATVPATALAGTSYSNSATVSYKPEEGYNDVHQTTNSTTSTVGKSYSVAVGPYGFPEGGASGAYTASGYTVTLSDDSQSIASVYSGTTVIFRHTLRNTGNASDSFTLGFSGVPTGWTCSLVADDLATPISGPVGPLSPGADYNFALKCQVPAEATGGPYTITVTATSVGDPNRTDSTTDTVNALADGFRFDLYGGVNGFGPYTQSQTTDGTAYTSDDPSTTRPPIYQNQQDQTYPSANPGAQVVYRLRVKNLNPNGQADNYTLLVQPGDGYADRVEGVLFYADKDDDGQPDGAPITSTGLVGKDEEFKYLAVVTLKNTAPPGPAQFTFAAQSSQSGAEPKDFAPTQINVNTVAQIALDPDRAGTVTSPGTVEYTHTLINNSNAPATCTLSGSGGSYGWTYQYSLDGTTWAPSLSGITVPAGGNQTIYVRVLVPAGEPIGRTDVNTLTASCTVGSGSATDTATETTTVVGGELRLSKSAKTYDSQGNVRSQDGSQAYPGDVIEYTVVAENIGTGNLSKAILTDLVPSYTDFVPGSISVTLSGFTGTVLYSTDGTTWSPTAPTTLASGRPIYVAVDTDGDGNITDADVMPPGAKITLTFKVQVQ